jgi:hypothetical protein
MGVMGEERVVPGGRGVRARGFRRTICGCVGGLVVPLAMTACPGAAELENPERFLIFHDPDDDTPVDCAQAPPDPALVGCEYARPLQRFCAQGGCHGSSKAGGLDLRLNDGLIARILEQPPVHRTTRCSGNVECVPEAKTCERCDRCPSGVVLLDRAEPSASYILTKMAAVIPGTTTANVNTGCGDGMPSFLASGIAAYAEADKACLESFFRHIATQTPNPERFPCELAVADAGADATADALPDAPAQD